MRKNILYILLCLCTSAICKAQQPSLYFKKITIQNGLSNNKVNCILQDKRGFVWIGTDDGLNRYDGNNFLIFRNNPVNAAGISGNIITALHQDSKEVIWIATADGGLSRYDYRLPGDKQFKQYKNNAAEKKSIPVNIINALVEDESGYLWLATSGKRAFRFNKRTEKFDSTIGTGTSTAVALCIDREKKLWVGRQGGGILKIDTRTLAFEYDKRYDNLYAKLPHTVVVSLFKDAENNIWYGSWDKVLYKYNPVTKAEEVFIQTPKPFSFSNDEISGFAEDKQQRLWMAGRYNGLQVFDKKQSRFYQYHFNPAVEGTIADNDVNCVFIDRNENLWLGTSKGISVSNLNQQFTQQFLGDNNNPVTVYDFYKDNSNTLWIGTSDGVYAQKKNESIPQHLHMQYKGERLAITKFYKDNDETMYFGTNYSLFRYNTSSHNIESLPDAAQDKVMGKIIESRVVSIIRDTINNKPVLLTSPYGHYLAYYDLTEKKWISRLDSTHNIVSAFNLTDNLIQKFYRSPDGKVWAAMTKEGLGAWEKTPTPKLVYYKNNPLDINSLSSNHVYDITSAGNNRLWVSTYGGGLQLFNSQTQKFRHITATANLLEGISTDSSGTVWMIGGGNLHSYKPATDTYNSYELPDIERSGGVSGYIYKDDGDNMYMAGKNYYIQFNPGEIKKEITKSEVIFTDFRVFNKSFSYLLFQNDIRLKYNQNFFTIEFASPHFSGSEKVYYSYKLEGVDKEWVDAGTRNFASYPNTGNGDFVFKVRASLENGKWNDFFYSIKIKVVPPFWKTWWFYSLLALFIAVTAYVLYRYRVNELLKRQAIRNKIAQDLHDNIGSTLSSISVYSQVAQIQGEGGNKEQMNEVLEKISITSNSMISEMNDIVWAINPRNDSMEKIIQRMDSFAKPLAAARNIQFDLQYSQSVLTLQLDMDGRKNLYLIFKEAINNAIKYAGASSLIVGIQVVNNRLMLKVKDNGVGFNPENEMKGNRATLSGNGLHNMYKRANELKGELQIDSQPGKGTTILLQISL